MRGLISVLFATLLTLPAVALDGLVVLRSRPPGAAASLMTDGRARQLCEATPATVRVPVGDRVLRLTLDGHETVDVKLRVLPGVQKPSVVELRVKTVRLTILGDDWNGARVVLDGLPALDADEHVARVPCTLLVTTGTAQIVLVLPDRQDVRHSVEVRDTCTLRLDGTEPTPGRSALEKRLRSFDHCGAWTKVDTGTVFVFRPNGRVEWRARPGTRWKDGTGMWTLRNGRVVLKVPSVGTYVLTAGETDELIGEKNWRFIRR